MIREMKEIFLFILLFSSALALSPACKPKKDGKGAHQPLAVRDSSLPPGAPEDPKMPMSTSETFEIGAQTPKLPIDLALAPCKPSLLENPYSKVEKTFADTAPDSLVDPLHSEGPGIPKVFEDADVVIYFEAGIPEGAKTWVSAYVKRLWNQAKLRYGSFANTRLHAIFHRNSKPGAVISYLSPRFSNRNLIDVGLSNLADPNDFSNYITVSNAVSQLVETSALGALGSPSKALWNATFADIFSYDMFKLMGCESLVAKAFEQSTNMFFRDFFKPIYDKAGPAYLTAYFSALRSLYPLMNGGYTQYLSADEFVAFMSFAAGFDVKELAAKGFAYSDKGGLAEAYKKFPALKSLALRHNLESSEVLALGQKLTSPNGQFTLELALDGNLNLMWRQAKIWSTNLVQPQSVSLRMQNDGNLVLSDINGQALWQSSTASSANTLGRAALGDDGLLTLQRTTGEVFYTLRGDRKLKTSLNSGEFLAAGEVLTSMNGLFQLSLHESGYLAVRHGYAVLWLVQIPGKKGTYLDVQADGNLVLYDGKREAIWATNTKATSTVLVLQDDGNLVLSQKADNKKLWSSNVISVDTLKTNSELDIGTKLISTNGKTYLNFTAGGLALYHEGKVVWNYPVTGIAATNFVMQGDGNLVLYNNKSPLWASNTFGSNHILRILDDGTMAVFRGTAKVWSSK